MAQKLKVAVVGYGNTGKEAVQGVLSAPDMELVGVVRRAAAPIDNLDVKVVTDIQDLGKVDVALLCTPTRQMTEAAAKCLALGINTVDSFDIHTSIFETRKELDAIAKANGKVSILSAGWDPGSDSIVRTLMQAMAPKGITYTNFGLGMSMGHSVAVRSKAGVKDAMSLTIPEGQGIHSRRVYVELEDGASFEAVKESILTDPYFVHDDTVVEQVENVKDLFDVGHGVLMERKGVSCTANNQRFSFSMSIDNPALTSQIMVACARATVRQQPGCYTMIEIPVVDLLPGDRDNWIKLV